MKENFPHTPTQRHNLRMEFVTAAEKGNIDHAQNIFLFRAQQGDIDAETLDLALIVSTRAGLPDFVRWLIEKTPLDLNRAGAEALAQALKERDVNVAKALIAPRQIDLSSESETLPHALALALQGVAPVDISLLQVLLDNGAKPLGATHDALDCAIQKQDLPALQLLLPHTGMSAQTALNIRLSRAATGLDLPALRFLITAGAEAAHNNGEAAKCVLSHLQFSTRESGKNIACCLHALLEAGGDPTGIIAQDALILASKKGNTPLVHYLLRIGTDPEPRMRGLGYNRLIIATKHNLGLLIDKMHETEKFDAHYYHEALHLAAENGHLRLIEKFISYGFDPKTTPEVDLPFAAIIGGQVDLVKILTQRGLTTNLTEPVLVEAVVNGDHADMLDYLLDHGANLDLAHTKSRGDGYAQVHHAKTAINAVLDKWDARAETIYDAKPFDPTLAALRSPCKTREGQDSTGFMLLAKAGRFDEALARHNPVTGDIITPKDLAAADSNGNRVIEILGAKHQLQKLFDPDRWHGRSAEMMALFKTVPPVYQKQVDAQQMTAQYYREILKTRLTKNPPPRL